MEHNISNLLAQITFDIPVLGYFLYQLELKEDNKILTCAVSTDTLYYNKEFLSKLTKEEVLGVLLHETVHSMFLHPSELNNGISKNKDKKLWAIALELVTNAEVIKLIECFKLKYKLPGSSFSPLNPKPIKDNIYYYDKTLADKDSITIYNILIEKYPKEFSLVEYGISIEDIENQHIDVIIPDKTKRPTNVLKLQEAYQEIKKQGYKSANLERLINILTKCHIPWEKILYSYISERIGSNNYSYNTRNFRHPYWEEIIIPGLTDEQIDVLVAIDTSGSISQKELTNFVNGIKGLYTYTDKIRIVSIDAKVNSIQDVSINELQKIKLIGGGGTDFRGFFRKFGKTSSTIVFFTDGFATYPEERYNNVLWVLTSQHQKPPFGKVIYIDSDDE